MRELPPGLSNISSHRFGTLSLIVHPPKSATRITHFTPHFLGQSQSQNMDSTNSPRSPVSTPVEYQIVTNLWNFYMYLSDMECLTLTLHGQRNANYSVVVKLPLKPVKDVMRRDYSGEDIIHHARNGVKAEVRDLNGDLLGTAQVCCWLTWDQRIVDEIRDVVDLGALVVFEGISPISSETQLPREPPLRTSIATSNPSRIRLSGSIETPSSEVIDQISQKQKEPKYIQSNNYDHHKDKHDDDHDQYRMMEQDIDKLISQMQAKPYDCSRYQQCGAVSQSPSPQFPSTHQYERSFGESKPDMGSTYLGVNSFAKNTHKNNSTNRFLETQISMKSSNTRAPSVSPPPRPPLPCQQQTILTKSPKLTKTCSSSDFYQSSSGISAHSPIIQGYLQLKIHEMLTSIAPSPSSSLSVSKIVQDCYTLKLYLNQDQDEYYVGQGIKEGETVNFNQALKVRNIAHLTKIRFTVSDDYGRVHAQGVFELTRLTSTNMRKGVFSVPLAPTQPPTHPTSRIKMESQKMQEVFPIHRSLRIEAQLVQQVEMVQIFLKISKISIPFTMLRYKIPLTKQTIQSCESSHTNIFPHSCTPQTPEKLLVQFWHNAESKGQCQISLKNIKNTNSAILASSLQPMYLYDGKKQIRNILEADCVVGDFELTLCFGTVKHMQGLFMAAIAGNAKTQKEDKTKVGVALDERLGVLVKAKPTLNEISIQVELEENQKDNNNKNKQHLPQFGDQSIISHASHNEFLEASMVSFARQEDEEEHTNHFIGRSATPAATTTTAKASLGTLTQDICGNIFPLIQVLVPLVEKIKSLAKQHLLYNFIAVPTLKSLLCQNLGLSTSLTEQIFKQVLFPKEDMVNINILYDFIAGIEADGKIDHKNISDQMLVVGALRLLYRQRQGASKGSKNREEEEGLLESGMEFREMVTLFRGVAIKLNLYEFGVLDKFMKNYPTTKDAIELREAVRKELDSEKIQKMRQGFYEQDILHQIYGNDSSFSCSNNQSQVSDGHQEQVQPHFETKSQLYITKMNQVPKKQPILVAVAPAIATTRVVANSLALQSKQSPTTISTSPMAKVRKPCRERLTILGTSQVIQSLECVRQELPQDLHLKVSIEYPTPTQLMYELSEQTKQLSINNSKGQVTDIDGKVWLMSGTSPIACAAFSLIRGVKSLYSLKIIGTGEFCGLLHLMFQ